MFCLERFHPNRPWFECSAWRLWIAWYFVTQTGAVIPHLRPWGRRVFSELKTAAEPIKKPYNYQATLKR